MLLFIKEIEQPDLTKRRKLLSNRSYLTSPQHCSIHNMSLFMAREGPGITGPGDQVVAPLGLVSASPEGRGLQADKLGVGAAEEICTIQAKSHFPNEGDVYQEE